MRYWLLILGLVFIGCQDVKRPEKPKNLIPKDKMVDILAEAYYANAAQSVRNRALFGEDIRLDSLVYAKFDIDSLQFVASNNYYAADVNTYIELFRKVEVKMTELEQELDRAREESQKNRDSLSEAARKRRNERSEEE